MSLETLLDFGSALLGAMLALGAALRARRAIDRWAFAGGMLVLAVERALSGVLTASGGSAYALDWQVWRLTAVGFIPGAWLLFSLTYARGNAGEFIRKWRLALAVAFILPVVIVLFFRAGLVITASAGADAEATTVIFRLGPAGTALYLLLLPAAILVLVNLEHTFRAAVGTVRWRIKFILMGAGVLFLVRLFTVIQTLLFRRIDNNLDILHSGALLVAAFLIIRSLFRAGHFSLDVHPSHSVLQGSVTILLVGVYLLIVGVFARIVSYLGGDSSFAIKALVVLVLLVLLAVFLQSDRVRMHLRRFVSRHFQRPLHDYRTVWRRFTEGTASQVEPIAFCRAVIKLHAEIFQALSVTLWLVDEGRMEMTLAASTSVSEDQALELRPDANETAAAIQYLRAFPEPVDIEKSDTEWAAALRRCHPAVFEKGGSRACAPVLAGGELLALIILGDRVGGTSFTLQDFDLLKALGDQVASGLLNVRLAQRLLQAREHEAFQTMAAFFVHDLKNAASTLNLMLKNLPDHFDDPAFREDALRGVGKSVAHINHLISRLSQLRNELNIQPVDSDLNEVVRAVLAKFEPGAGFQIETDLGAVPRLALDREQFAKVVTNLILNAREAATGPGRLKISTARSGTWAILSSVDNGCGMSADFLSRSLFRPFKTTKKSGLGIGMFQSKMIIEAHGGRIAVESSPGQGTTFRVFLPISSKSITP